MAWLLLYVLAVGVVTFLLVGLVKRDPWFWAQVVTSPSTKVTPF
jgi:hypothetical protein